MCKHLFKVLFLSVLVTGLLLPAQLIFATESADSTIRQNFVTPTLNVDIPGLKFTNAVSADCSTDSTQKCIQTTFIAQYIDAVYKILIGIATVVAVVMIMIGGLQYTLGAGGSEVGKGSERIKNGIVGLVLLLCIFLILNTVNPQLALLKMVELQNVNVVALPPVDEGDVSFDPAKKLCHSLKECEDMVCPPNPPPAGPNSMPKLVKATGYSNPGGAQGSPEMQAALEKAGLIAVSINPKYMIQTQGALTGYRSVSSQVTKACNDIKNNEGKQLLAKKLAWPGGSNHGTGIAVDVVLMNNSSPFSDASLNLFGDAAMSHKDGALTLLKIMDQAGFVRYNVETWHFELKEKASSSCRCNVQTCAWPPPTKC